MFENITSFFKKIFNKTEAKENSSKTAAKERLHLVLMQDRANVSADFLDLMRQEIIEVIKKYIDVDEKEIDVRLTNKTNEDGTNGAPALYANIPIVSIKNSNKKDIEDNNKNDKNEEETLLEDSSYNDEKISNKEDKKEDLKEKIEESNEETETNPEIEENKKEEAQA
ncbi:MAG: cell division topological specificity factor MinE [Clostridia bacterium]|nr:cell division topological specificity factor MinE [Clostridia bacterium]